FPSSCFPDGGNGIDFGACTGVGPFPSWCYPADMSPTSCSPTPMTGDGQPCGSSGCPSGTTCVVLGSKSVCLYSCVAGNGMPSQAYCSCQRICSAIPALAGGTANVCGSCDPIAQNCVDAAFSRCG